MSGAFKDRSSTVKPHWPRRLWRRLRPLVRHTQVERELDEELQYHADRLVGELRAGGMPEHEAQLAARRQMGAVDSQKEACRDARGWITMHDWARHIRLAVRALRRSPGYTAVSLASLTCGLTLAGVSVTLVHSYLQRGLPFPSAERLYHVIYAEPGQPEPRALASIDWSLAGDFVEAVDRSLATRFYVTDETATRELQGLLVSPDAVDMLGLRTVIGRGLDSADFKPDADRVAVIGNAMWRDRFGGSPDALGQLVRASSGDQTRAADAYRIVGVLPPGFRYARNYARAEIDMVAPARSPGAAYMVRLRPHASVAAVAHLIGEQVAGLPNPTRVRGSSNVRLESVHERYVAELRPTLVAIALAVALALVVAVANVTILTLLRVMHRHKEVAVRLALGATRRQIFGFLTAEACLLMAAACGLSVVLTTVALDWLGPTIERQLGRPAPVRTDAFGFDMPVLAVLGALGLLVAIVLSALPLMAAWPRALAERLRRDQRAGADSRAVHLARGALMALEIGGTLILVVGSGLMTQSVANIVRTDLGIRPAGVLRTRLALPAASYGDPAALSQFYAQFLDKLGGRLNGPAAVMSTPVIAEPPQQRLETADGTASRAGVRAVSPDYFTLLGMQVQRGRAFTAEDHVNGEPVAIVAEALAQRLWPNDDAVGQRIRTGERPIANAEVGEWRRVVGVVSDVRQSFLDRDSDDVYLPFLQTPSQYAPAIARIRTTVAADGDILREVVATIDRAVLVGPMVSLADEAAEQTAGARFLAALLTGCSLLAAMIAMIGLYGATAYTVHQQEREVGVRLALGATPHSIVRQFLRRTAWLVAAGIMFGVPGALLFARVIRQHLFGVSPLDLGILAGGGALLAVCSVLATWRPVSRVSRQDPALVLRRD